jgi:hypothetical protein
LLRVALRLTGYAENSSTADAKKQIGQGCFALGRPVRELNSPAPRTRTKQLGTAWSIRSFFCTNNIFEAAQVFLGHSSGREPLLKHLSDGSAIQPVKCVNCLDSLAFILHDKARHPVVNNLWDGAATPSDYRSAASHGFNHYQPEWFWPVDWEEKSRRIP